MRRPPLPPAAAFCALALPMAACTNPFHVVGVRPIWAYQDGCIDVELTGTGFEDGVAVWWGGEPAETAWPDAEIDAGYALTITGIPAHDPGQVAITVEQGGDTQGVGTAFTYAYCRPAPRVDLATLVDADGIPLDWADIAGGAQVVLEGCGFAEGTTVSIGGVDANIASRDCTIGLVVDVPPGAAFGAVDVVVTTPDGDVNADWTIDYGCDGPDVVAVDPAVADVAGGTVVTVSGCGFYDDGFVHTRAFLGGDGVDPLSGEELDVVVLDATTLMLTLPSAEAGSVSLGLANPDPADLTGATVLSSGFWADAIAFVVPVRLDLVAPDQGGVSGGYPVDLFGDGFSIDTTVTWAGIDLDAAEWTLIDGSHIGIAASPPGAAVGPVDVTVSDPVAGSATATFVYVGE
jgi:hypothetical protein